MSLSDWKIVSSDFVRRERVFSFDILALSLLRHIGNPVRTHWTKTIDHSKSPSIVFFDFDLIEMVEEDILLISANHVEGGEVIFLITSSILLSKLPTQLGELSNEFRSVCDNMLSLKEIRMIHES